MAKVNASCLVLQWSLKKEYFSILYPQLYRVTCLPLHGYGHDSESVRQSINIFVLNMSGKRRKGRLVSFYSSLHGIIHIYMYSNVLRENSLGNLINTTSNSQVVNVIMLYNFSCCFNKVDRHDCLGVRIPSLVNQSR